jgi:hypothetical protein
MIIIYLPNRSICIMFVFDLLLSTFILIAPSLVLLVIVMLDIAVITVSIFRHHNVKYLTGFYS